MRTGIERPAPRRPRLSTALGEAIAAVADTRDELAETLTRQAGELAC